MNEQQPPENVRQMPTMHFHEAESEPVPSTTVAMRLLGVALATLVSAGITVVVGLLVVAAIRWAYGVAF